MRHLALCLLAIVWGSIPAVASEPYEETLLRTQLWHQVLSLPPGERPTVGLVLSGGGVRGLAHVGVVKVLEDAGFPIDVVTGTSMGAIIGSLYAAGFAMPDPKDLPKYVSEVSIANPGTIRLLRLIITDHLMSTQSLEDFINRQIGELQFYQLKKRFACVAMDIKTGEPIVFRDGPVAPAVRASMNMPGVFTPVEYRHRYLVDGGVVDYVPIDIAKRLGAQWVIASVTEGDYTQAPPTTVLGTLEQVIDIQGSILAHQQRRQANMLIEPSVGNVFFYQTQRSQEVAEKGVLAASQKLREAEENLILFSLPRLWRHWIAPESRKPS
jgi:NTE family protein